MGRIGLVALAVAVLTSAGAASTHTPPPAGLSAHGRLVWNFEGVLWRTLGTAHACEAVNIRGFHSFNWTRRACGRAICCRVEWFPIFARAHGRAFTTTTARPPTLGNVAPIRVGGRFVRCSAAAWLVENNAGAMLCLRE